MQKYLLLELHPKEARKFYSEEIIELSTSALADHEENLTLRESLHKSLVVYSSLVVWVFVCLYAV